MLDRAFRDTFQSYSTLFLVIAAVTIPLHLIHAAVFRDVIATRPIHSQISEFPNYRQVRNVGPKDLTAARVGYWALTGLEIALVPLGLRAVRRVLEVEARDGVATVMDAWRHALSRSDERRRSADRSVPAVVVAVIVAFVLGFLIERIGLVAVDILGDDAAWVGVAVVQGSARAAAVPFALSALVSGRIIKEEPLVTPKLY